MLYKWLIQRDMTAACKHFSQVFFTSTYVIVGGKWYQTAFHFMPFSMHGWWVELDKNALIENQTTKNVLN